VVRTGEAAVAVGLLQYGFRMRKDQILAQHHENALSDSFDGMAQKIKEFFGQVF
jgi:cytochrome c-type biogenesis protein CcmE